MKTTVLFLSVAMLSVCTLAQTAKVIPLTPAETAQARQKYEALQMAQKEWDEFAEKVKAERTVVPETDKDAGDTILASSWPSSGIICADQILTIDRHIPSRAETEECHRQQAEERKKQPPPMAYRAGWENGFLFSTDFMFIVPKPSPPIQPSPLFAAPVLNVKEVQ